MVKKSFFITVFLLSASMGFSQEDCQCCTENHRAFDFWIGEWKVTDTNGNMVGTNTITKLEDNCILNESWKSANGNSTGTSTNFYNNTTKQWEQLWVDNSGSHLKLKGSRLNNQMILSSDEFVGSDEKKTVHRITWTANKDGTVRQHWETLQEGKVVNVAFDGLYIRKE